MVAGWGVVLAAFSLVVRLNIPQWVFGTVVSGVVIIFLAISMLTQWRSAKKNESSAFWLLASVAIPLFGIMLYESLRMDRTELFRLSSKGFLIAYPLGFIIVHFLVRWFLSRESV